MNKFGVVLGVAAVATLAGCMDPNYKRPGERAQNTVRPAAPEVAPATVAPVAVTPDVTPSTAAVVIETEEQKCSCLPGTKHDKPCGCGASDCACVVEPATAPVVEPVPVVAAPVTTDYIVQRGDYLAKISKRFNVKLDALRKANPQLKNDVVMIGQKIKIPGKVDVGEQTIPEGSFKKPPKREYKPYTGATKDYVVKSGDTLGGIAYGNGINIRQLKELNGLNSDLIRVGQTLKIPAAVAAAPAPVAKPAAAAKPAAVAPAAVEVPQPVAGEVQPAVVEEAQPQVVEQVAAALPADEGITHVVQDGEDITGLAIRYSLSPAEIRDINNLGENDEIKPGQVLKLPADTQL